MPKALRSRILKKMQNNYVIFVIDDTEHARFMLDTALKGTYVVETFDSAEACLERLAVATPDLFLIDVGLPGIDGYELCRQIRERDGLVNAPAIFISGLDDLESSLKGYDAGGIDFVVKPYKMATLRQKIEVGRRTMVEKKLLNADFAEAKNTTALVLSNLDEYGALIQFLRALSSAEHHRQVIDAGLAMLDAYQLCGVIQVRLPEITLSVSENGENFPLEVAVLKHVSQMERIVEFDSRSAYNFACITILVNDMPVEDAALCGRLRDHLAIAAEAGNARLQALQTIAENLRTRADIEQVIIALGEAARADGERYQHARQRGPVIARLMQENVVAAFSKLGMTEFQEREIQHIIGISIDELTEVYDIGDDSLQRLSELTNQLSAILDAGATATDKPAAVAILSAIELF